MTLGGEFLRELALLILVFYPLDVYIQVQDLETLGSGRHFRGGGDSVDERRYSRRGDS